MRGWYQHHARMGTLDERRGLLMTKLYSRMTLSDLIEALGALPDGALVRGITPSVHSYRGYYERNAVSPNSLVRGARELGEYLVGEIGKPIHGWKGGDYTVST